MQATELRIGNVVEYFNSKKWIGTIIDAEKLFNYQPASYRGVPLNYEILERSGFSGTEEKDIFTSIVLPINVEFRYNGNFASPYLIFALTDKEWEVKL